MSVLANSMNLVSTRLVRATIDHVQSTLWGINQLFGVSWILLASDMIPILWRHVPDNERDSVTDVSFESARAAIQPVNDNGTVYSGIHILNGYAQGAPDMA